MHHTVAELMTIDEKLDRLLFLVDKLGQWVVSGIIMVAVLVIFQDMLGSRKKP